MIPGFNHNIMHKGKIYHIQTEDSGPRRPHLITHLFVGGNILSTKKTDYTEIVNEENIEEIVRELMEEQHNEMLKELKDGMFDPDRKDDTEEKEEEEEEKTIGDETIDSAKSLDEVILDYLGDEIKE